MLRGEQGDHRAVGTMAMLPAVCLATTALTATQIDPAPAPPTRAEHAFGRLAEEDLHVRDELAAAHVRDVAAIVLV
jgi:hypothetical protein